MSQKSESKLKSRRRKRREVEPLKVNLTVAVRFGEDDEDRVVLLDDREVHMIGSIFRYRDKIARYTVTGNLLTTTDSLNRTTALTYDAAGNVATSQDALLRTTTFTYDGMDRLTTVLDADGKTTAYGYDLVGNLTSVTDANTQPTTFTYDALDQVLSTTNPVGNIKEFVYDANRHLGQVLDAKGQTSTLTYDAANQLVSKVLQDASAVVQDTVTYEYDALGNLTLVQDSDSKLTFTYDPLGRLTQADTGEARNPAFAQPVTNVQYAYDSHGNRQTLIVTGIDNILYTYDALDQLTLINPQSFSEFISAPQDQSRIPLWSLQVQRELGPQLGVDLLLIPDLSLHDIPEPGALYEITSPLLSPQGAATTPPDLDTLALALDRPFQTRALALLAPLTHVQAEVDPVFKGLEVRSGFMRRFLGNTIAVPMAKMTAEKVLAHAFAPEKPVPDFLVRGGGGLGLRPKAFVTGCGDLVSLEQSLPRQVARYGELTVPGGVLYGADDALLSAKAQGRPMTAYKLKYEELPGRGHMLPITAPEECAAFIRKIAKPA